MKIKTFFMLPIIVTVAILAWLVMGFSMLLYKITGKP
jgi:hypothetical protein